MTARVLELENILEPDNLAQQISEEWLEKDMMRNQWKNQLEEVHRYTFATDTSQTGNSNLQWKNSTTIPKACQIRDNVIAQYLAALFPKKKNLYWEANERDANAVRKRNSIINRAAWWMSQPSFKHEIEKVLSDYFDGNCFVTVEWVDQRWNHNGQPQSGYVGPGVRRINPYDIVMNPPAENFQVSPKIIRSFINKGELKELLERMSNDENREEYEKLWEYLKDIRNAAVQFSGDITQRDRIYSMEGFTSFRDYLGSNYVEILTFYGDIYDDETETLLKNHVITVVDRHKLIGKKPNPSFFGYPPIFHAAWRKRPNNLWGMGALDNLIGLQYRMDHVENMKADIFDLVTYPVQKIKGFVEDFVWQPGEKIYVSEEGDVEMHVPDVQALQANFEIQNIERLMEEMAGSPKEAMGFRTPGEKTAYEVQRLENAAARIFQSKIKQFEEQILEPLLNAMLELDRRNMTGVNTIKVFDEETGEADFQDLTPEDITGIGRIRPVAARHFAEQAEMVQNLTNLANSQLWPTVQPHFSGIKIAKILEETFNLKDYGIVTPYIALAEQADAQKQAQALEEQIAMETQTATGMGEDFDMENAPTPEQLSPPVEELQ